MFYTPDRKPGVSSSTFCIITIFYYGIIRERIIPNDFTIIYPTIMQLDLNLAGIAYNVAVGYYISISQDNESRSTLIFIKIINPIISLIYSSQNLIKSIIDFIMKRLTDQISD